MICKKYICAQFIDKHLQCIFLGTAITYFFIQINRRPQWVCLLFHHATKRSRGWNNISLSFRFAQILIKRNGRCLGFLFAQLLVKRNGRCVSFHFAQWHSKSIFRAWFHGNFWLTLSTNPDWVFVSATYKATSWKMGCLKQNLSSIFSFVSHDIDSVQIQTRECTTFSSMITANPISLPFLNTIISPAQVKWHWPIYSKVHHFLNSITLSTQISHVQMSVFYVILKHNKFMLILVC